MWEFSFFFLELQIQIFLYFLPFSSYLINLQTSKVNVLFCGWNTAKLTSLERFGFSFNYSGFLVNDNLVFNDCVIIASFI